MSKISVNVEEITPAKAARLLSVLHARQPGRSSLVTARHYARQMAEGTWDEAVAQTISVSDQGELLDGWHRLTAVTLAGRPVRFLVARGVPVTAFANFDSGRVRSLAFRSDMNKDDASVCNAVWRVVAHNRGTDSSSRVKATVADIQRVADFLREEMNYFRDHVSLTKRRRLTSAAIRTACLLQMKANPMLWYQLVKEYEYLQQGNLGVAARMTCVLYRRLMEEHFPQDRALGMAWRAFDPKRASAGILQLSATAMMLNEIRSTVLAPLVQEWEGAPAN